MMTEETRSFALVWSTILGVTVGLPTYAVVWANSRGGFLVYWFLGRGVILMASLMGDKSNIVTARKSDLVQSPVIMDLLIKKKTM